MSGWRSLRRRAPTAVWLLLVWLLLWWQWEPATALFGVLATLAVLVLFPLPDVRTPHALRPGSLLVLVGLTLADVAMSAVRVGRDALVRPRPGAAIASIEFLSDLDHVVAISANTLTLSPGTFVVEIDTVHRRFYVYALGIDGPDDVARIRRTARRLQWWVLRAVAPRSELDRARSAGEKVGRWTS